LNIPPRESGRYRNARRPARRVESLRERSTATLSLLRFSTSADAEAALTTVRDLGDCASLRGAGMLRWPTGHRGPTVRQVLSAGAAGALGEAFWDMLLVVTYLLPVAGAAAGASPSACRCSLARLGIGDEFLRDAQRHVRSGSDLLFLMTKHANVDPILSVFGHVGFSVTSTNLTSRQLSVLETYFGPAGGPAKDEPAPAGGDHESEPAR
jgi:uncharacterized membrane protein